MVAVFVFHQLIFTFSHLHICLLIVTLLTFQTTDVFYRQAVHFAGFEIVVELLVYAIEFVSRAVAVVEGNLGLAVAVDAPAHAER